MWYNIYNEMERAKEQIQNFEREYIMKTIAEIESTMRLHHTASRRGYVSRRTEGKVEQYEGRFGKGYIIVLPRWDTTQYVTLKYYIEEE